MISPDQFRHVERKAQLHRCALVTVVALVGLLAACDRLFGPPLTLSRSGEALTKDCTNLATGELCLVPLTVKSNPSALGGCIVYYDYSKIEAKLGVSIIWELSGDAGHEFFGGSAAKEKKGIDINKPVPQLTDFVEHGWPKDAQGAVVKTQFKWYSRGGKVGTDFHYDIAVRKSGATDACKFEDPVIVNRG